MIRNNRLISYDISSFLMSKLFFFDCFNSMKKIICATLFGGHVLRGLIIKSHVSSIFNSF